MFVKRKGFLILIVVLDLNTRGGDNKIVLKSSIVFVSVLSFIVKVFVPVLIALTYVLILNKSSITLWCVKFLVRMYAETLLFEGFVIVWSRVAILSLPEYFIILN